MKYLVVLLVSFLLSITIHAQDPVYRTVNNLNGLPSNIVYNIMQDEKGFVWIGHDKGLSKFDGKRFFNFVATKQKGRAVSNILDAGDKIYCQDFSGNFYYTANDSLLIIDNLKPYNFNNAGILNKNTHVSFTIDHIRFLNISTNQVTSRKINDKVTYANFFTPNKGYFLTDKSIITFSENHFSEKKIDLLGESFFYLIKADSQFYLFKKADYNNVYTIVGNTIKPVMLFKEKLFVQNVDLINDEIWIATSKGAYCFNKDLTPKYSGHCFYNGTSISKVFKDREGNYWFGTLNKGILLVLSINTFQYHYNNSSLTSIYTDDKQNDILIGTGINELLSFNNETKEFKKIIKLPTELDLINIDKDKQGNIFLMTDFTYVLNPQRQLQQTISLSSKSIAQINDSQYAIAFSTGISLFNWNSKELGTPQCFTKSKLTIQKDKLYLIDEPIRTRCVNYDKEDSILYAGTSNGLKYFSNKGNGEIELNGKEIYAAQILEHNKLRYVATFNHGIVVLKGRNVVKQISLENGLLSNTVYKMTADSSGIWLITDNAIQFYNIRNATFKNFKTSDCLPKAELKDIAIKDGYVFVATPDGLIQFSKQLNTTNFIPPQIELNSFLVNNTPVKYYPNMVLKYNQNTIDIDYSALSYKGDNDISVEYRINKGKWNKLQQQSGLLNLPVLSSDNYDLELIAKNEDGVVCKQPLVFAFKIQPPIYKRPFAIILFVLAVFLVGFLLFKRRIKEINTKNELEAQKLQLEQDLQKSMLASIKSQMNPHFLFNALNTIQSYIYTNDKENASIYLGKFSELTRLILDMSNKDTVTLTDEIKSLKLYLELEKLRFEDKLNYQFNVSIELSTDTTYIPPMIIQPYVENAIKHGLLHKKKEREVVISFHKETTGVVVKIEDNGIGRKKSEELKKVKKSRHLSFSTNANEKRLDILNKGMSQNIALEIIDKENEYGEATGTIVILHIPYLTNKNTK